MEDIESITRGAEERRLDELVLIIVLPLHGGDKHRCPVEEPGPHQPGLRQLGELAPVLRGGSRPGGTRPPPFDGGNRAYVMRSG